ncbi:MAG: LytTR family DNA-binding domain-containing protein [Lachnospiraceae bacterium]|nr:LytTR family DNA-binding domain-containing protein [Lachnospiraceae bacterium]
MRIGICEDEQPQLRFLEHEIEAYCAQHGVPAETESFGSAEELLFQYEGAMPFDCLLLDIRMKQMDGMELAANIRKKDRAIPIIFVTGDRSAVFDGYKVGAVRYLLKPIRRQDFYEALDYVRGQGLGGEARERGKTKEDFWCFPYEGDFVRLEKSDIRYIDVQGHYVSVHTEEKDYCYKETLAHLREELHDDRFVQASRSALVNMEHVEAITRQECVLAGDVRVPVSRGCLKELNRAFMDFYDTRNEK